MSIRPDDDEILRDDVSRLGHLLGETLERLEGKSVFAHVELARRSARDRRDGVAGSESRFSRLLSDLSADEATAVSRAFSTYFGLVNLAERVHRIRTRRQASRSDTPLPESFEAVLSRLIEKGLEAGEIQAILDASMFKPVFTAHPTEAVRRTLLTKEQRIARTLLERNERPARLQLAQEAAVLLATLGLEHPELDPHTGPSQATQAPTRNRCMRIPVPHDHAADAGLEDALDARSGAPDMGARLERDRQRGPAHRALAVSPEGAVERQHLRVRTSDRSRAPAPEHPITAEDDRPHRRVR